MGTEFFIICSASTTQGRNRAGKFNPTAIDGKNEVGAQDNNCPFLYLLPAQQSQ
jgi:hypothetical protein